MTRALEQLIVDSSRCTAVLAVALDQTWNCYRLISERTIYRLIRLLQALWLATLDEMTHQSDADLSTLSSICEYIAAGVTLPLISSPPALPCRITFTVSQNTEAVATASTII